jgi:hypothetical protein
MDGDSVSPPLWITFHVKTPSLEIQVKDEVVTKEKI